jgi:hypothetical protein
MMHVCVVHVNLWNFTLSDWLLMFLEGDVLKNKWPCLIQENYVNNLWRCIWNWFVHIFTLTCSLSKPKIHILKKEGNCVCSFMTYLGYIYSLLLKFIILVHENHFINFCCWKFQNIDINKITEKADT